MTPDDEPIALKSKRHWLQFRLRTLIIVLLILSGMLAWYVRERTRLESYRAALRSIGGHWATTRAQPKWHYWLFGDDPHYYVVSFYVNEKSGDESFSLLRDLKNLEYLSLDNTQVTDEGMLLLKDFPKLKDLQLRNTKITDAGMTNLKDCRAYRLDISGTKVTPTGRLNYLKAHPNAKVLPIP